MSCRVTVCDIRQVSVGGAALEGELGVVGEELEFIVLYELAGISHSNDITLNVSARGPTADYIVSTQDELVTHVHYYLVLLSTHFRNSGFTSY